MDSKELGENYNKIAGWWTHQMKGSDYGMNYMRKAMGLSKERSKVLDIGCGSTGRTIGEAIKNGFEITGIDISSEMIRITKEKYPDADLIVEDFATFDSPHGFDLIIAWDSLFHAPKDLQREFTIKMCDLLNRDGVLLFTAGGIDGQRSGKMDGVVFEYGSLKYLEYLNIFDRSGLKVVLMESDQYPLDHMVFICQKTGSGQNDKR